MYSDWANLRKDILASILERLVSISDNLLSDYLGFSMVSRSWHYVAKDRRREYDETLGYNQPPMLLIPVGKKGIWQLYNVMNDSLLDLQLQISKKRFCGSSRGWLITVDKRFRVKLINPFSRIKGMKRKENSIIRLPPLAPPSWEKIKHLVRNRSNIIIKATLSADPVLNANDCFVVVIYELLNKLAFIRLGKDTIWTYIENQDIGALYEVVPIREKFYAINHSSQLFSVDSTTSQSNLNVRLITRKVEQQSLMNVYLVNLNEKELLMVHRYIAYGLPRANRTTEKFKIFQLDDDKCEWIEKDSLGDFTLFLGNNTSIAMLASNIPGCQSDCIYFTHDDDCVLMGFGSCGPSDLGVYDLKSGTINFQPYSKPAMTLVKRSILPPIWIVPTMQL